MLMFFRIQYEVPPHTFPVHQGAFYKMELPNNINNTKLKYMFLQLSLCYIKCK